MACLFQKIVSFDKESYFCIEKLRKECNLLEMSVS